MAKHHTRRIRGIHTRYVLVMLNVVFFGGLVAYGLLARANEMIEKADGAALTAMMDVGQADAVLMPPEVLGGR